MDYLVGIDLGSTNLKAVVFSADGEQIAGASRPTELFHPEPDHPDWAVWRPEQLYAGVADSLAEAIGRLDEPERIRGVCVTGMGMDGLPMGRNGEFLYPLIAWHCPRTTPQYEWWLEHVGRERQFAVGGNQIWPFNSALRLLWMKEHHPEILDRMHKWVLIEDFINTMLCGELATDYSMASTTLLFNQTTQTWDDLLIEEVGLTRDWLCDPKPSGTVIGEVHAAAAERTGLPQGTPVVLGGHDYCCGMLPTGVFKPGVIQSTMGTWEMVVTSLDRPVLAPEVLESAILVDSHVAPGRWAAMGATVAAEQLEWFRREFGREAQEQSKADGRPVWEHLLEEAAGIAPGSDELLYLPHMSGSHCPIVDPASSGVFVGIRNTTTKHRMLRAMIEGLAFEFAQIVGAMERSFEFTTERIIAVGGGTKNPIWLQAKADILDRPIEIATADEAVALGAAMLAGLGTGVYSEIESAYGTVSRPNRAIAPIPENRRIYQQRAPVFEELYRALIPIHAALR